MYAKSKYPEVAGDMLGYLGSEVGQTAFQQAIAGAQPSVFAKANQATGIDPLARRKIFSRLEGFAQKGREPAADRFDRLI